MTGTNLVAGHEGALLTFPVGLTEFPQIGSLSITGSVVLTVPKLTVFETVVVTGSGQADGFYVHDDIQNFWAGFSWFVVLWIGAAIIRLAYRALSDRPTSDVL